MEPLRTKRLALHPWSEDDRPHFAELARDPKVMRFIGDGSTWDDARIAEVFERQARHWDEHGFGWYSVAQDGRWAGFVGANHVGPEAVDASPEDVEIGWWLHPEHWGLGLATEGATAVRDDAFTRVRLDRIIGRFRPDNAASGAIMEKLGMTFVRDALGAHGGLVRIYALERTRWERLRAEARSGRA